MFWGGMWGSNPRHSEYQFLPVLGHFWDTFLHKMRQLFPIGNYLYFS